MYLLIIFIIAAIGVIMTLTVLLQSGKGGGLSGIAAGSQTTQLLGTRQAPDILEKATWGLATAFIVLCVVSNFFVGSRTAQESVIQQGAQSLPAETPALPGATVPGEGAQQTPVDAPSTPLQEGGGTPEGSEQ